MNTEQVNSVQPVGKAIAGALVKAQMAFGPALKTSQNPHFKSRYADLSACVEAVIEALNANGIALIQRTLPCESGVTVETVFLHSSGETMSSGPLHVPASKQDPQGYGSALTYARRYSLMAACGIAPEDDDGNAASKSASSARSVARAIPSGKAEIIYEAPTAPTSRMTDEAPKKSNGQRSAKAAVVTDEAEDDLPW